MIDYLSFTLLQMKYMGCFAANQYMKKKKVLKEENCFGFTNVSFSSGLKPISSNVVTMLKSPLLRSTATCNAVLPWNDKTAERLYINDSLLLSILYC